MTTYTAPTSVSDVLDQYLRTHMALGHPSGDLIADRLRTKYGHLTLTTRGANELDGMLDQDVLVTASFFDDPDNVLRPLPPHLVAEGDQMQARQADLRSMVDGLTEAVLDGEFDGGLFDGPPID